MNKINTLISAFEKADAVKIFGVPTSYDIDVSVSSVAGEPENEVVYFNWTDDDGQEFSVSLTEEGLDDANVNGNSIKCNDNEGEPTEILLYVLKPFFFPI